MDVSVILSTYNQPEWLEKTLLGYACQTHSGLEVVIADDGSTDETRSLIERVGEETGLRINHVWHEDRGFQKSVILNKAIMAARHDLLLFSDGDCIPRRDFVATHVAHAEPGWFLSGGYFKLSRDASERIGPDEIRSGQFSDPRWLRAHGVGGGRKMLKLAVRGWFAKLLDAVTLTRATWNGHNASGWKADLLRVNGFDERMQYYGQDRELGERLFNAGLRSKQIRHRAICLHLDHDRPYRTDRTMGKNREIRRITRSEERVWTDHGIRKPASDEEPQPSSAHPELRGETPRA